MTKTATRQLIEARLGQDLEAYVRDLRSKEQSWRRVAEAIEMRTGVKVSHQTVCTWFPQFVHVRVIKGDAA